MAVDDVAVLDCTPRRPGIRIKKGETYQNYVGKIRDFGVSAISCNSHLVHEPSCVYCKSFNAFFNSDESGLVLKRSHNGIGHSHTVPPHEVSRFCLRKSHSRVRIAPDAIPENNASVRKILPEDQSAHHSPATICKETTEYSPRIEKQSKDATSNETSSLNWKDLEGASNTARDARAFVDKAQSLKDTHSQEFPEGLSYCTKKPTGTFAAEEFPFGAAFRQDYPADPSSCKRQLHQGNPTCAFANASFVARQFQCADVLDLTTDEQRPGVCVSLDLQITQFPVSFTTQSGDTVRLLEPDGRFAVVDGRGFAGASGVALRVVYGLGGSATVATAALRGIPLVAHVVPFEDGYALYVGKLSLRGGGAFWSLFHNCRDNVTYVCSACGFACPKLECERCCCHKDHECRQRQNLRERNRDALIQKLLEEEISSFNGIFETVHSNVSNTTNSREQVQSRITVEATPEELNDGVLDFQDMDSDESFGFEMVTAPGSLSVPHNTVAPPVLKLPKLRQQFQLKFSLPNDSQQPCIPDESSYSSCIRETEYFKNEQRLVEKLIRHGSSDSITINKFRFLWKQFSETCSNDRDRTQFLTLLLQQSKTSSVSLIDICSIIQLVLKQKPIVFIFDSVKNYLQLKKLWLENCLLSLLQLTTSEKRELATILANFQWSSDLYDIFIKSINTDMDIKEVLEFLSFLERLEVPDAILLPVILSNVQPKNKISQIKMWTYNIIYQQMCNSLDVPHNLIDKITPFFFRSIQMNLSPESLFAFLTTHLKTSGDVQMVGQILQIFHNYQVANSTCEQILAGLTSRPQTEWPSYVDASIISEIFQNPIELKVEELINRIVEDSNRFGDSNNERLPQFASIRLHYDSICAARKNSKDTEDLISEYLYGIKALAKMNIRNWACDVRNKRIECSINDMIAKIINAVEIHFKFEPKPIQILSLLVLLEKESDKGRLAQINTGEGKSLIVAMLAAVHALQGKKVDIITASSELACREVKNSKDFFEMLSLSVGENTENSDSKNAYKCDIVYGTASDFLGDILKEKFLGKDTRIGRAHQVVIVDEVDSMLFDNRSCYVRLSQAIPGMNHLLLVLGAIWVHVNRIAHHLIERNGKTYFIGEDFQLKGESIVLKSGRNWEDEAVYVEDHRKFITDHTQGHGFNLIRDLNDEERNEYTEFQKVEKEIEDALDKNPSLVNDLSNKLKNLPWFSNNRDPILEIPRHLRTFARHQLPFWIKNAIEAAGVYKKDAHYAVKGDRIVPIHYDENGELQMSLVWSDGLTQFLQIKEDLPVDAESISTNYLSNIGFFKRYGSNIFGVTGTLGEISTQAFLSETYKVDLVFIPPQTYRYISPDYNNRVSPYLCKEMVPIIVQDETTWYECIVSNGLFHAIQNRAVLVICRYVFQVKRIINIFKAHYNTQKVFAYTGEEEFSKHYVQTGEIIVATNIAGRGADFITSPEVENNGGLYVSITFLPRSYRVEMQNVGRTARNGKKGSSQLIILDSSNTDIEILKMRRQEQELEASKRAKKDVQKVLIQDKLFEKFCDFEKELLPSLSDCELEMKWIQLQLEWDEFRRRKNNSTFGEFLSWATKFGKGIATAWSNLFPQPNNSNNGSSLDEDTLSKTNESLKANLPTKTEYEDKLLSSFCKSRDDPIPPSLLKCLKEEKQFTPARPELSVKYSWGCFERQGLEERWALWLRGKHFESCDELECAYLQFEDEFKRPIDKDASDDNLIENPYYYVLKGNEHYLNAMATSILLVSKRTEILDSAVICYDKAIKLDQSFSAYSRYNKACALLSYQWNVGEHQTKALIELQEAKKLISYKLRPDLLIFNSFIGQSNVESKTIRHIQHQLDILNHQEEFINKAIDVLKGAQKKKRHVKLTTITLKNAFGLSSEDHSKAIRAETANGLIQFFSIQEIIPIPWGSLVLCLIAVTEIVIGGFLCACLELPVGFDLILDGISNLIDSLISVLSPTFDWGVWAVKKATTVAMIVMVSGWRNVITTYRNVTSISTEIVAKAITTIHNVISERGKNETNNKEHPLKACFSDAELISRETLIRERIETSVVSLVKDSLDSKLLNSPELKLGIYLDKRNGVEYWQQCYIQEAEILSTRGRISKEEKEIQKTICSLFQDLRNKMSLEGNIPSHIEADIKKYLEDLLEQYMKTVITRHQSVLNSDKNDKSSLKQTVIKLLSWPNKNSSEEKLKSEAQQVETTMKGPVGESSNEKPDIENMKRLNPKFGLSPQQRIVDLLCTHLSKRLCQSIRQSDATRSASFGSYSRFTEVMKITTQIRERVRDKLNEIQLSSNANSPIPSSNELTGESSPNSIPAISKTRLSKESEAAIQQLREQVTISRETLSLVASTLERPILVFEDERGKLVHVEGDPMNSRQIMLKISPGSDGMPDLCATMEGCFPESSNDSNFLEVVWAQVDPENQNRLRNKEGLREALIRRIMEEPSTANHLFQKAKVRNTSHKKTECGNRLWKHPFSFPWL